MKSFIILLLTVFLGTACAQNTKNIPSALQNKLKALYPKAEEVKWDKEAPNFEANFKLNNVEMSLLLDAKGHLLETETGLEIKNLPAAVKASLSKTFFGYEIKEVAKIVRNGKATFEAELKKGETKLDAIFDEQGTLIKKIEKKENDEESEKAESGQKEENEENENEK